MRGVAHLVAAELRECDLMCSARYGNTYEVYNSPHAFGGEAVFAPTSWRCQLRFEGSLQLESATAYNPNSRPQSVQFGGAFTAPFCRERGFVVLTLYTVQIAYTISIALRRPPAGDSNVGRERNNCSLLIVDQFCSIIRLE